MILCVNECAQYCKTLSIHTPVCYFFASHDAKVGLGPWTYYSYMWPLSHHHCDQISEMLTLLARIARVSKLQEQIDILFIALFTIDVHTAWLSFAS